MLNDISLQGRLAADPELQQTANTKKSVVSVRLAVQRDTNKYAEEDNVDWINLVFWDKLAENISKYGQKGDMIIVLGRLQSRKYEDVKKQDHIVYEVYVDKFYFCVRKSREEEPPALGEPAPTRKHRGSTQGVNVYYSDDNSDGELPF